MGNLAFRESFDMMKEGKSHFAVDLIRGGMALLGPFSSVPWLVKIGLNLPGIAQSWKKMLQWSEEQLQQRLKVSMGVCIPANDFSANSDLNSRVTWTNLMLVKLI